MCLHGGGGGGEIIIMGISVAHDPWQDLEHNALYKKLQKNVSTHTKYKIKKVLGHMTTNHARIYIQQL